ncbi:GNAT family N-acetyltransferase [Cohnella xylanilytica]|uniref:GNAT family N-acetyltransferase n=2 Tax=Cohnella xylanilytica TaxID=557555 RepID=A0A841U126_9BACL|nr:GNAT family N-acetyltransferase [Cohnella xylanilytica]MBB6691634.1 GNAT family N-acetyltransferase [Cohnella xylanilytica]
MQIEKLVPEDKRRLLKLYRTVTADLRKDGVKQWDLFYPNGFVVKKDLLRGTAFGIRDGGRIVAAVVVDREMSDLYGPLDWEDREGTPACIHRLAVHPELQGRGVGKRLLAFAENEAREIGGTSIRLDVFSGNPGALSLYGKNGYREVGRVRYPMRKLPYFCMEKRL